MLKATLIINQPGHATQEVESGESVLSIGSALDNLICLEDDTGVRRYHAIIERHEDGFRLNDLGTHQGTRVNGETVFSECELKDGDRITLGGTCVIEFYCHESSTLPPASDVSSNSSSSHAGSELSYAVGSAMGSGLSTASSNLSAGTSNAAATHALVEPAASVSTEEAAGGMSTATKTGVGIAGGLLLTGAAALLFNVFGGGGCHPSVRILTPLSGATLRSAATIRVEARETSCIKRVSYQLDGEEIANAAAAPYEATLDPHRLPRMTAGNHVLTATVETSDGSQVRQSGEVYVAFSAQVEEPRVAPPVPEPTSEPRVNAANTGSLNSFETQAMAEQLASQISGKSGYIFEREMTTRIQSRTANYAAASSLERAARYRRIIVKAFSDRGLKPLLGFVLAMSRSQFDDAANREGQGMWRVPPSVAQGYLQPGESPSALDNPQRAAEISAVYLKDLLGVFETENFDLAVACYGSTLEEAGALKQRVVSIPATERRNFWQLVERGIINQEQSERVVKFYAAGIVGENPQNFGASSDRRLSALEY
ncbi:MAG TPA: FHA domain-containing protein [Pyrinomonadaceae bacterium]|jgi:pSer/pThr/pTyr-binding forkhead associated (FHA) protein|nr:FHA domain-containing protein [Pyrinomonadaceae bacterium]